MPKPLLHGRFVRRLNRFSVQVELDDGQNVVAHLPNSGRLEEVLQVGKGFWLAQRFNAHRRTRYDVVLGEDGEVLVCVDARLPPKLLLEGLAEGKVKNFGEILAIRTEVPYDDHRLDLQLLYRPPQRPFAHRLPNCVWWVETKSVTLVVNGVALFPDAPTVRGQKHLRLLAELRRKGYLAAIVFIVQRPDVRTFAPNLRADPEFAKALRDASLVGVHVLAYSCSVSLDSVCIAEPLPVSLDMPQRLFASM